MSIRIGGSDEPEVPKSAAQHIGEGIGCLLSAVAIAVIWWAISGFPALPR